MSKVVSVNKNDSSFSGWSIFRLIIVIMLILVVARTLIAPNSPNSITFSGFLQTLVDCPKVDLSKLSVLSDLTIAGDWGIFNFLKTFLESIIAIFTIFLYIVSCFAQLITFILYFLRYVFVGA